MSDESVGSAAFLGLLQGVTEFLPVSSSGHLVLFQQFFEVAGDEVLFDLVLHLGTLLPVLWFYRADVLGVLRSPFVESGPFWQRPGARLAGLVVVATIPTGIIGVLFKDFFETLFATPAVLAVTFAITGGLLFSTRGRPDGEIDLAKMDVGRALLLGVAQGLAITPGISRSGTTLAVALMLGLKREWAARLSFLMSVPAILGAVVLKVKDADAADFHATPMLVGFLVAMVSGYVALDLLVRIVKGGKLDRFAWYCWAAAIAAGLIALWA